MHLTGQELNAVQRDDSNKPLVEEIAEIQRLRNGVVHRGEMVTQVDAERAVNICLTTIVYILNPVLGALGLQSRKGEGIQLIKCA